MTTILSPDHFTVLTDDLLVTEDFYTKLLGFTVGPRPDFNFPGLWLYANDVAILHIKQVDQMPSPRNGVLDHMAFRGKDVNNLLRKLKTAGSNYRITRAPAPWDQWQVFFEDPNGVVVEVDFNGQEILEPEHQTMPPD